MVVRAPRLRTFTPALLVFSVPTPMRSRPLRSAARVVTATSAVVAWAMTPFSPTVRTSFGCIAPRVDDS